MWVLIGFDRQTEREVESVRVPYLSDDDVRVMFGLAPGADCMGMFDVIGAAVAQIQQRIGRALRVDLDYQLGPFAG